MNRGMTKMRRCRYNNKLSMVCLVMVFSAAGGYAQTDVSFAEQKPNIIFILADDLGFSDLGCYGGEIPTPNLDQMAEKGLRFSNFYNESKCSPSRATLLAGVSWHQTGTGCGEKQLTKGNFTTLPRVLKTVGYRTGVFGKWHGSKDGGAHGFDHWVERTQGQLHFTASVDVDGKPLVLDPPRYGTDLFTDYAIDFIDKGEEPFFIFMAYYAPHFPLQAKEEWIAPHRSVYAKGWDKIRAERYAKQVEQKIIPEEWSLSPRESAVPAWDTLTKEEQKEEAELMSVHAAMVQRLDFNIGRLLKHLEEKNIQENTLLFFCSDNGACPWVFNRTPDALPGPAESFRSFDSKWANACNTPFRFYKQWTYDGGIHTPGIALWGKGIKEPGRSTPFAAHLIDVMPTLVELTGASYPTNVLPMEGVSFLPAFTDVSATRKEPIFWEFFGGRAMLDGDWKFVGERTKASKLYNIKEDGTELNDLSEQYPERYAEMRKKYDKWARKVGAKTEKRGRQTPPTKQIRMWDKNTNR